MKNEADNSSHIEQLEGEDSAVATSNNVNASTPNNSAPTQLESNEAVCIRLAREDLQAKLSAHEPQDSQPVQDADEDAPSKANDDNLLVDSQQIRRESRELSTMIKVVETEEIPPLTLGKAETTEEISDNLLPASSDTLLGAIAVNGSTATSPQRIQPLRPIHPDRFHSSSSDVEQQDPQQQPTSPTTATTSNQNHNEPLLEATLVHEESSSNGNPHGDSKLVVSAEELICGFSTQQWWYLGGCLGLVVVAVVVFLALLATRTTKITLGDNDDNDSTASSPSPTAAPLPTLEQIRLRGVLRCGVWKESLDFFNFAKIYTSQDDQVDFVLCRAYAAAILGNASHHQIVLTSQQDNLLQLAQGQIDILLSHVETGMQNDVWEPQLHQGFCFSVPYVYTDLVYGGLPHYVACADDNMNARGNCSGLQICTNDNSVYFDAIASQVPESHLVKRNDTLDIVMGFVQGDCNVMPSENSGIMEWGLQLLAYTGDYVRGTIPFAKDVVTVATRDDDVEFSDFVNLILLGLMAAEQANVTQETADQMAESAVLGNELVQAVEAVGNYNKVYQTGVAPVMKRGVWNLLNNGTTGLLYSLPLGKVRTIGPRPGGTLAEIWEREDRKLHCGIRPNRPGFASLDRSGKWVGMDIEYCTALAASALEGEAQSIEFVPMDNVTNGYQRLQAKEVDVLAGFTWDAINDYQEPTTKQGYSYSQPYFYRPVKGLMLNSSLVSFEPDEDNLAMVTRQDDPRFSSFVYWTVAATFYASENGLSTSTANQMPDVNLFGDDYIKMFRDTVYFAGSYDEIYERNLGRLLPERGRNAINPIKSPGPQLYVPPGFLARSETVQR